MSKKSKRVTLVVGLQLMMAIFFILGVDGTNREAYILYQSYLADIVIPFSFYFLLTLNENYKLFDNWQKRTLAIFFLCSTSEVLQFFGIFAPARVFDPVDFVMYGAGVLLAALVDRKLFTRLFSFWE